YSVNIYHDTTGHLRFAMLLGGPSNTQASLEKAAEDALKAGAAGGTMVLQSPDGTLVGRPFGSAWWSDGSGWQVIPKDFLKSTVIQLSDVVVPSTIKAPLQIVMNLKPTSWLKART
ncbi:hypothetical protein KFL_014370010, partial [Klebsormidium nitens]